MLEHKLKQSLIYLYTQQGGYDWTALGRAIEWRLGIIRKFVKRDASLDDIQNAASALTIQRQIETEIEQYQRNLQVLATQLQNGDIEENEFIEQIEIITAAIYFIAYLNGSQTENEAAQQLIEDAKAALETMGVWTGAIVDQAMIEAAIPEEARNNIDSQLAISATSAINLAQKILEKAYDEDENILLNRLVLWVNKALEMYAWGQLFRADNPFLKWLVYALKRHCRDCLRLDGQVHTAQEWRASGFWPRCNNLECRGWACGCSFIESEGPSRGNF